MFREIKIFSNHASFAGKLEIRSADFRNHESFGKRIVLWHVIEPFGIEKPDLAGGGKAWVFAEARQNNHFFTESQLCDTADKSAV